jgi:suppressor of ftsI
MNRSDQGEHLSLYIATERTSLMRIHPFSPIAFSLFVSSLVLVGCSGSGGGNIPPASALGDLSNPLEVQSSNGVAMLHLSAVLDPHTGAPAFAYQGSEQAPTIRVNPGDTIDLTYENDLPPSSSDPLNMTNLHFHGLTVSPNPPADDVMLMAMPGQSMHYSLQIPPEQPPGIYWYHPHAHGETNWQVSNGMAGAIIVDGVSSYAPQLVGMRERVMIVRDNLMRPDFSTLAKLTRTLSSKRARLDNGLTSSTCSSQPEENRALTVNGVTAPTISIAPGERQFWRIVNAGAGRYLDLAVDGESVQLVSLDGVSLAVYPGNAVTQTVGHVLVPPAGRAEIIVTGQSSGAALRTLCVDSGPIGDPDPAAVLAVLMPPTSATSATIAKTIVKPSSLRFKAGSGNGAYTALPAPTAKRTITLSESADGLSFFINGQAFDMNAPPLITVQSGTVEEWTVLNTTQEVHDFHIHQVHFVAEDVNGQTQSPYRWVDTINVPYETTAADGTMTPGEVKLLMDFRDPVVRGTFMFHCHILEHEDGGMMAKIAVQ